MDGRGSKAERLGKEILAIEPVEEGINATIFYLFIRVILWFGGLSIHGWRNNIY